MTSSTLLTLLRVQGDPEMIERVRVIVREIER